MTLEFTLDERDIRLLALFVAGLVKEGIVFKLSRDAYAVRVELTGGF